MLMTHPLRCYWAIVGVTSPSLMWTRYENRINGCRQIKTRWILHLIKNESTKFFQENNCVDLFFANSLKKQTIVLCGLIIFF